MNNVLGIFTLCVHVPVRLFDFISKILFVRVYRIAIFAFFFFSFEKWKETKTLLKPCGNSIWIIQKVLISTKLRNVTWTRRQSQRNRWKQKSKMEMIALEYFSFIYFFRMKKRRVCGKTFPVSINFLIEHKWFFQIVDFLLEFIVDCALCVYLHERRCRRRATRNKILSFCVVCTNQTFV